MSYQRISSVILIYIVISCALEASGEVWREPSTGQNWFKLEHVDALDELDGDYEAAICRTLRCLKGEECIFHGRVATCQCRRTCPHNDRPVCASDGVTYPSHCHIHREACISGKRLHTVRHGRCEEVTSEELPPVLFTNATTVNGSSDGGQRQERWSTAEVSSTQFLTTSAASSATFNDRPAVVTEEKHADPILTSVVASTTPSGLTSTISRTTTGTASTVCSNEDFYYVPSNLLLYFHAKYAQGGSAGPSEKGKSYLVHLIFNHLDLNADRILTKDELHHLEKEGKYTKLMPAGCHLMDILTRADTDGDGQLNEREFFRLFGLPVAFIAPHNEIKMHRVDVGQQYQLFCDIEKYNSAPLKVTWYRYDVPLVNVAPYDFEVSADGSLYLTPAALTHNGNFSCRVPISVASGPSAASASLEFASNVLQQVHVVNVFERVRISVSPDFLLLKTGENGYLQCDVQGYPMPKISWDKNGRPFRENVSVLQLTNVRSYDTGSYRCASSFGPGVDNNGNGGDFPHRSASVVVRDRYEQPEMALRFNSRHHADAFFALYESGIRQYRADDCTLLHAIPASYPIKEEKQGYLCRDKRCNWSDAVVTQPATYLYATLLDQLALIKINVTTGNVEQFFHLNHLPKKLWYIEWEDSLWVEGWHDPSGNYRTIQTIRSASKAMRHSLTHALPLRDEFDAVNRVFLPSHGKLKYGYVTHWRERALHKIDLHSLKVVSRVSLVPYDCQPNEVAFVAQVGLAVVQCAPPSQAIGNRTSGGGQLILDYISDATLGYDADAHGFPVATVDGQWLVNVDTILGRIFVHKVEEKGGPLVATIDEFLPINDWTLHQATTFGSWDLYVAPRNGINLIKISIPDAKIERLSPTFADPNPEKPITLVSTHKRTHYLAGATSNSVLVIDLFNSSSNNCRIHLNGTEKIVWTN